MVLSLSDTSTASTPPRRGLAIASLVLGLLAIPTLGLLVVGGVVAVVLGIVALVKIRNQPAAYGGTGFAIGGIVAGAVSLALIPVFGIVAAIAIPSLSRAATSANEASAIGRLRMIVSAEIAYSMSNGGAFDTLECLARPSACGFDTTVPSYLPADGAAPSASGYHFIFLNGAPADRSGAPGIVSPSSMDRFAVIAEPERQDQTGVRHFCVDSTAVLRVAPKLISPGDVMAGVCPVAWPELQ
jgi:type II secretory pathway pseudopilin PulG